MIRKILKYLGITIASLLVLITIGFSVIVNFPTIILNQYVIGKATEYASDFGYSIKYSDVKVSSNSKGFLDEKLEIEFKDLCIKSEAELQKACFDDLSVAFGYAFIWLIPRVTEIGPITITNGQVAIKEVKKENIEEKEIKKDFKPIELPDVTLPRLLKKTKFYPINIEISSFEYSDSESQIRGKAKITADNNERHRLKSIDIDAQVSIPKQGLTTNLKGDISSKSGLRKNDLAITANTKINGRDFGHINLDLEANQHSLHKLDYKVKVGFNKDTLKTNTTLAGGIDKHRIHAELDVNMTDSKSVARKVSIQDCGVELKKRGYLGNNGKLKLECPLTVSLAPIDLPDEVDPLYKTPEVIRVTLSTDLNTFFMPDIDHHTKGKIELKLTSITSKIFRTSGNINTHIKGDFSNLPNSMHISSDMNVDFKIPDFTKVVAMFKDTDYPIPAPLNALRGDATFSLKGKVPSLESLSQFPVVFSSKLEATNEKLFIDAKGEAKLTLKASAVNHIDVDADITLTDIEIPLPTLGLAGLPVFTPDSRISLEEGPSEIKKDLEDDFTYNVKVKTPEDEPLKIFSNLVKKSIPIHIDIVAHDEKLDGEIKIDKFPINLFKRDAFIDSFKLKLDNPFENSMISAQMTINVTDYLIHVMMAGTVEQPKIWFESDPPLSEENIIAVLLYGEPFDDVDSDQALSVGNVRAAMSNSALALSTFFIFASTPIQTVAYNPETGAVAAKIKLGDKTSLTLGSSRGSRKSVGVRRRLGKGWSINTSVIQDPDETGTIGQAFLEWHKRY